MRSRIIVLLLLVAVSLILANSAIFALGTGSSQMTHEWKFEVGDILYFNGEYHTVWKRMEALHPVDMNTYYYYQIAPEGSMKGEWIWEGNIKINSMRMSVEGESEEDPPPPAKCPPHGTPPPC